MEAKKVLIIVSIVLATMVVALTSFIAGMYIPKPGMTPGMMPGNVPAMNQPPANQPPARPPVPGKKPSSYNIGRPYSVAMKRHRPVIAVFYVDWCHFCQAFMPKFEDLAKAYRGKMTFTTVNVEDPKNADIVKEYDIKAYPTVFFINPTTKEKEQVDSSAFATKETMKEAIDTYLKKAAK